MSHGEKESTEGQKDQATGHHPDPSRATHGAKVMSAPIPYLPLALGALIVTAIVVKVKRGKTPTSTVKGESQNTNEMTPAVQAIYEQVLRLKDVNMMAEQAQNFEDNGYRDQAAVIRKRIALKTASPEVKAKREAIYRECLASNDKAQIIEVAAMFKDIGATGSAENLLKYAAGLP
jgi:hypothetical protein